MKSKLGLSVGVIAATAALAGCSSATSTQARSGVQTTTTTPVAQASAPPSTSPTTTQALSSAADSTTAPTAQAKPVSALLAGITAPVTTANMPKAQPAWIAVVQHVDDTGKAITGQDDLNLAALVDEAATTSDVDALLKMCNLCDAQKLQQTLTAKDGSGLTGFQELSRVLEKTHPAPSYTQANGWDFPGFTRPEKGAATTLDQQDMKLLGANKAGSYTGIRAQFMNLNDGPNPYDGWTGTGKPNT